MEFKNKSLFLLNQAYAPFDCYLSIFALASSLCSHNSTLCSISSIVLDCTYW